ncbi:hypothetical protein [Pseudonocardia sp. MH-G8]|uniref:TetR/AcrR family transcriptional regulator n=1 Tax=Pseudonocardia sp. MH-G8 TaxID=1854588 RepID=UPI0013041E24
MDIHTAEHFLSRWEHDEKFTALLHAAVTHPVARSRPHDIFDTQVCSAIEGLAPNRESAPARAGLITSQVVGTALCRYGYAEVSSSIPDDPRSPQRSPEGAR